MQKMSAVCATNYYICIHDGLYDDLIQVPKTDDFFAGFGVTVAMQLLAYHTTVYRGYNVDQPRNLAKSVTVE